MKKTNYAVAIVAALTVLASCSVEKRVYRDGYHVEWNGRSKAKTTKVDSEMNQAMVKESDPEQMANETEVSVTQEIAPLEQTNVAKENKMSPSESPQTKTITRKQRREIKESMREISQDNYWEAGVPSPTMDMAEQTSLSRVDLIICVIVAIFIPPLGVYLYQGDITTDFWISLVLTLLLYFPGLIYSLYVILAK